MELLCFDLLPVCSERCLPGSLHSGPHFLTLQAMARIKNNLTALCFVGTGWHKGIYNLIIVHFSVCIIQIEKFLWWYYVELGINVPCSKTDSQTKAQFRTIIPHAPTKDKKNRGRLGSYSVLFDSQQTNSFPFMKGMKKITTDNKTCVHRSRG